MALRDVVLLGILLVQKCAAETYGGGGFAFGAGVAIGQNPQAAGGGVVDGANAHGLGQADADNGISLGVSHAVKYPSVSVPSFRSGYGYRWGRPWGAWRSLESPQKNNLPVESSTPVATPATLSIRPEPQNPLALCQKEALSAQERCKLCLTAACNYFCPRIFHPYLLACISRRIPAGQLPMPSGLVHISTKIASIVNVPDKDPFESTFQQIQEYVGSMIQYLN